jgi:hypothetical protein
MAQWQERMHGQAISAKSMARRFYERMPSTEVNMGIIIFYTRILSPFLFPAPTEQTNMGWCV